MIACRWFLVAFAYLALSGCGRRTYGLELTTELEAGHDLTCQAYVAAETKDVNYVVLWMSGSGLITNATIPEWLVPLIERSDVAVVTFNKPGLEAPFGEPENSHVDSPTLEKYTQGNLLRCAQEALEWSEEVFGTDVKFLLRGHSEGALIAVYLYEALLEENPDRAARTPQLLLTGFPVEPFSDIISRQVDALPEPDRTTVLSAIDDCNWQVMQKAFALSCEYLEDAEKRPSGREVFEQMASTNSPAEFYFFHGRYDENTPVSFIEELQTWNTEAGHLDMSFTYYDGGHGGTDLARAELSELLQSLTNAR